MVRWTSATWRWLPCQCRPGQTSFCCPQSWCRHGRWNVNESHMSHVDASCFSFAASCFSAMRQMRSIRRLLPSTAREMLITSLVHSRLDYCNAIFAGLPACDIRRLQSVLNPSVRLVTGAQKMWSCDVFATWSPLAAIAKRIEYKLYTLVYRC